MEEMLNRTLFGMGFLPEDNGDAPVPEPPHPKKK